MAKGSISFINWSCYDFIKLSLQNGQMTFLTCLYPINPSTSPLLFIFSSYEKIIYITEDWKDQIAAQHTVNSGDRAVKHTAFCHNLSFKPFYSMLLRQNCFKELQGVPQKKSPFLIQQNGDLFGVQWNIFEFTIQSYLWWNNHQSNKLHQVVMILDLSLRPN